MKSFPRNKMVLLQKIKNIIARFKTSEFDRLRYKYINVPRYTPTVIIFRDIIFETPDAPSAIWQIKEIFFDEHLKFASKSLSPTIIDCGANIGTTVIYFKKLFPKADITAFEADPKIARILEKNILANKINGVAVKACAVWTNDKGILFSPDNADGGSIQKTTGEIKVPSARLKDLIEEKKHIDMLKIDIEGAETDVLLDCGGILSKVHFLFTEYHSRENEPQALDKILKLLTENNFRYFLETSGRHEPHFAKKITPDKQMDFQTNIYAINKSVGTN